MVTTRAIAVMGKVPRPGRVKTRLVPPLTPDEAARLYDAFLTDVIALVDSAAVMCRARPFWFVGLGPDDRLTDVEGRTSPGWTLLPQVSGDLGRRMEAARRATEADRVVLVGADAPTMHRSRFDEAFKELRPGRVVVGPTEDGGYDLIGLCQEDSAPFDQIPWSTSGVLAATRAAAQRLGLGWVELSMGYDLDTAADLMRALQDGGAECAPLTRNAITAVKDRLLLSVETD